jgi:hypothetical protein
MRKTIKKIMTVTAVLAAFAGGSTLYVYADTPDSDAPSDMMGMMQQMSEMMTTCNEMMQGTAHHETET